MATHLDLIAVDRVVDHGDHVHDLRGGDPHVWLDPLLVVQMVNVLRQFLAELDPDGAAAFADNADAYAVELNALHEELVAAFATIAPERRRLVVFHDAFTYFAARYDFEIIGVVVKNPAAEPSTREFADLVSTIRETGAPVVFGEPQFNADLLDQLAAETGVVVGELLTDAFAGRVSTYLDLMRYNRDALLAHLGPNAVENNASS